MKKLLELCEFIDDTEKLQINVTYWKTILSFKGVVIKENSLEKAVENMKIELNKKNNEELSLEDEETYKREVY